MVQKPDSEDLHSSVHHEDLEAALVGVVGQLLHPGSSSEGPGEGSGLVIGAGRQDTFRSNLLGTIMGGNYFT